MVYAYIVTGMQNAMSGLHSNVAAVQSNLLSLSEPVQ